MSELAEIIKEIETIEESSLLWKFHRYIELEKRWNRLFTIPFKHMWE